MKKEIARLVIGIIGCGICLASGAMAAAGNEYGIWLLAFAIWLFEKLDYWELKDDIKELRK